MRTRLLATGRPMTVAASPAARARIGDGFHVARTHLHDRAELLGEQRGEHVGSRSRHLDVEPAARRERHLRKRDEQAAVADVVIGEQHAGRAQLLDEREERGKARR